MGGPRISDHALVRFLDHAGGQDMEGLRDRLQASLSRAHTAARAMGNSDYLITVDGLVFVVRAETVSTVIPDDSGVGGRARSLRRPEVKP